MLLNNCDFMYLLKGSRWGVRRDPWITIWGIINFKRQRKWYKQGLGRKEMCGSRAITSKYAMLTPKILATTRLTSIVSLRDRNGRARWGQEASTSLHGASVPVEEALLPSATFPGGHVRLSSLAPTLCSPRSCKWLTRNCLAGPSQGCVY